MVLAKIAIASLMLLVIIPVFAEKPENALDVIVIPENISGKANDKVNLTILVTNYSPISSDVTKLYVNGVKEPSFTKSPDSILITNSSLTIVHTYIISGDPGTHTISIAVQDEDGNTGIDLVNLTISGPTATITNVGLTLDKIALLMAAYLIPAQIIERVLVSLKTKHKGDIIHKQKLLLQDQKIITFGKMREKLVEKAIGNLSSSVSSQILKRLKIDIAKHDLLEIADAHNSSARNNSYIKAITSTEIDALLKIGTDTQKIKEFLATKNVQNIDDQVNPIAEKLSALDESLDEFLNNRYSTTFNGDELTTVIQNIKKEYTLRDAYQKHLEKIDGDIADAQKEKSEHQSGHELKIWLIGCGIALVPGFVLSMVGVGLLQVLGINDPVMRGLDVIISALFIGSSTKPIHDIIDYIQKARTPK